MMRRLAVVLIGILALTGCGLRGKLDRPAPMFGSERAAYEAEQKRKAEEAAAAKAAASGQAGQRQRTEIPVTATEPAVKAPETLQPAPPRSPFQRPN